MSATNPMGQFTLYATVFITGAAIMVIELLGTRLIAPFYGSSLYVWSSLISVTMIALAVGYFLGGRLAGRSWPGNLSVVIVSSGLVTLVIPLVIRPVLLLTNPLGLRTGSFASALLLFTPSLSLLGMVGPIAIQRATRSMDKVGEGVGSTYAVSTVGSVFGTLLLGFYLFSRLGSREIMTVLGMILVVFGSILGLRDRIYSPMMVFILLAAGSALSAFELLDLNSSSTDSRFVLKMQRESIYGWVRVIDDPSNNLRLLASDASVIGAGGLSDGQNRLTYQQIVALMPILRPDMNNALLIGQGAGHMAMSLRDRYGISTDTIEIDPVVAWAATEYFGFTPTGQAMVGDGRYAIRHLTGPYDLIIHDCFTGGTEPAHLLTEETLIQLRQKLAERGLLALNFVGFRSEGNNKALASVLRTVQTVFPYTRVFRSEPDKDFNDFIILASTRELGLDAPGLTDEMRHWLVERETSVDSSKGVLLTDDFNPIESLQVSKAETYRNMVVDWLGHDRLLR